MFRGELFIVFMVFRSKSRVNDPSNHMIASSGSPTNLKTISAEVNLDTAGDYVIVVANMRSGKEGEGKYSLQVTLNDFKSNIKLLE
mmetsp:Transcript_7891/g.1037  ORF Transcript_7891/g.1037 Transcript_7891/m.1037 type:complete len:86 (+) Transcript_7891:5707-5964(+)